MMKLEDVAEALELAQELETIRPALHEIEAIDKEDRPSGPEGVLLKDCIEIMHLGGRIKTTLAPTHPGYVEVRRLVIESLTKREAELVTRLAELGVDASDGAKAAAADGNGRSQEAVAG